MGTIFSKKEKSQITEQDRAVLGLKKQRDKLKQYQNADKAYKDALTKVGQANMIEEKKIAFAQGTEKLILQLKNLILQSNAASAHKHARGLAR